ncbi:sugar transferase [Flavivirga eckloniae]|uniref:Lipid carrier--UDP-N-acetylgalactosaminyltransferase n=1 Tax=Flavivirga eckloniae TaxID=1803846 RepID=A0A2K9PKY2_9FLAO|nr:sugar transferase [Flavivirga eckloniae]AUP77247.1 lipid carrier--UDP-N-acetylgalactosaminyltransferase [Flavivirga eckloniae]
MYKHILKRLIDFFAALIGLILLSPIIIFTIIFLFFANKGTPFFIHPRPGKNDKVFNLIKFKTMNDKKDENGEFLPFDQRVTKVGAFIRKYSLDELLQLINVLKGDMSLIGPRPLLVEYLPLYNETQKRRHEVKPGITGWAQVNGRNTILWVKKFEYDVWYVDNLSFMLDIKILLLTIKKVIIKEGVNNSESLNMTTFSGGDNE